MTDYTISHGSRHMNGFGKMHSARLRHKLLWGPLLDDWLDALAWQVVLLSCPACLHSCILSAFWCFSHVGIVQFGLVISAGIIRWTWMDMAYSSVPQHLATLLLWDWPFGSFTLGSHQAPQASYHQHACASKSRPELNKICHDPMPYILYFRVCMHVYLYNIQYTLYFFYVNIGSDYMIYIWF